MVLKYVSRKHLLQYPHINPIAFHIGPLPVLVWFNALAGITGWCPLVWRVKRFDYGLTTEQVGDLIFDKASDFRRAHWLRLIV